MSNLSQRTISFRDILEFRIEYRKSSITACASERTRPLSFHFFERHVPGVVNIQCIRSTIGYKSYPLLYFSPAIPQRQLNNFLKRSTPSDVGGRRNLWRVRQHPDRWCTARGSRSRILRRGSSSPHPPLTSVFYYFAFGIFASRVFVFSAMHDEILARNTDQRSPIRCASTFPSRNGFLSSEYDYPNFPPRPSYDH